jgi:hypothetical protein
MYNGVEQKLIDYGSGWGTDDLDERMMSGPSTVRPKAILL